MIKENFKANLLSVTKNKKFNEETRRLADEILHSASHSTVKLEGTKFFLEPLKILQLSIFDPLLEPHQLQAVRGSVYGDDFLFTRKNGEQISVDWKLQTATFSDPLWGIAPPDYCCISKDQFDRYRKSKPTTILLERQITNFDPTYLSGKKNLDAFNFKKMEPRASWHYAQITPKELASWKKGRDYFVSYTKGLKADTLVVFRLSNLRRVKDLTGYIKEGLKKLILL